MEWRINDSAEKYDRHNNKNRFACLSYHVFVNRATVWKSVCGSCLFSLRTLLVMQMIIGLVIHWRGHINLEIENH